MILNALVEKLKRRAKDGFKGRHFEATLILQAVSWHLRCTDLTTTITGEGQVAVFVAVDHCSAECIGIHAARRATRFEALEPIRQGVRRCFGGFAQGIGRGLAVRHDHGSQYMPTPSRRSLPSSASRARPPLRGLPRGTAAPSASSGP